MTSLSGLVYSTCKCGFLLYESLMSRTFAVSLLICLEQYATQNIIYVGGSHQPTELGRNTGWVVSWLAIVEAFAAVQLSFLFFWNIVLRYSLIGLPINSPSYCRRIEFSVGCLHQMWKTCSIQQQQQKIRGYETFVGIFQGWWSLEALDSTEWQWIIIKW